MGLCASEPEKDIEVTVNPPSSDSPKVSEVELNSESKSSSEKDGTIKAKRRISTSRMLGVIGVNSQNVTRNMFRQPIDTGKDVSTKTKIQRALHKKVIEVKGKQISFSRLLLKFEKVNNVLKDVKNIFNEVSKGDELGLDLPALERALASLEVQMSREEIRDLFGFIDLDGSKKIELKEFLVCLTVGLILNKIPAFINIEDDTCVNNSAISSASPEKVTLVFQNKTEQIKEMLTLIISAYLIFDTKGEGFIKRESLEKILEEEGHRSGQNDDLSKEIWKKMDWDKNGTIDFAEFVLTFASWVDVNDIMSKDGQDNE